MTQLTLEFYYEPADMGLSVGEKKTEIRCHLNNKLFEHWKTCEYCKKFCDFESNSCDTIMPTLLAFKKAGTLFREVSHWNLREQSFRL